MDYHSMKRSELQALCKKHKILATTTNSVMADKLSELLNVQEKQKPRSRTRTCIKSPVETIDESESAVSRRQTKKVRFSPEVEYEQSVEKQKAIEPVVGKGRRKSVVKKVDEPPVDIVINTVTNVDVQIPVKVTRSRASTLGKADVIPTNERKQGRRGAKAVEKETDAVKETEGNLGKVTRSKANTVAKGGVQHGKNKESKEIEIESKPVKETVAVRATRSKAQTLTEDSKDLDLSPQVKEKSGRQTKKDEEKVEPSKEVKNVPVRVTRSRGQTSHDDNVAANPPAEKRKTRRDDSLVSNPPVEKKRTRRDDAEVANPPAEKKRTRRETMVAEVSEIQDNADKGTRQSRRNKANVEDSTVPKEDESKVETVNERKVTRSKAPLANKASVGKGKVETDSKMVQQLEEPLEPAGKKNVNRRKSVIQPKIAEEVLPLEEPVNVPARRDTRRKSVVQKVQVKESKKPLVGKKKTVKETELPGSPNVRITRKTVEKMQPKDASEKETKTVAGDSGSQKTRKRRGEPIVEDDTIGTEPVSTHKDSAVKKDQGSGVKTPASKSKKRAKMSGIKQNDSEDLAEKSNTMGTPISKMANLKLDDEVIETEQTPVIAESGRRFTRGAIRSDKKEPIQSAIKEQKTGAALLSSRKTRGKPTRSGIKVDEKSQSTESTRQSQPLGDVMGSPEAADETIAVPSEVSKEANAQIFEQSGDISAPEIVSEAEVQVTSEKSEIPEILEKEVESTKSDTMGTPILKMANLELDDKVVETQQIPAIDESSKRFTRSAVRSDRKEPFQSAIKKSARKTPGRFTRSAIKVNEKNQPTESTRQSQTLDEDQKVSPEAAEAKSSPDETILVPSEAPEEANTQILEESGDVSAPESVRLPTIDALSDGSPVHNQNQEVHVSSVMVSEVEAQTEVNLEKSVIPEVSENVTELTKSDTMGTPISKMANLELDDKVVETEQIPAIDESSRRLTRSVIRSDRKQPSQSAIKKQKTGAALLSARKTPGRSTRSAYKASEKNVPSESTHESQPLDDAQVAPPDAAGANSSPDETIAVSAEAHKEGVTQILEQSGDLSAPESVRLPTIDALSDESHAQNQDQEVLVSSGIVSEAVDLEKSVIPEVLEKESELIKSESRSEGLETDVMVEETVVSAVKTAVIEESIDISLEQSDVTGKSKEEIEAPQPSIAQGVSQLFADDEVHAQIDDEDDNKVDDNDEDDKASNQKHEDVADKVDAQDMDSIEEGDDIEPKKADIEEPSTGDDKLLQSLGMDENDIEQEHDNKVDNNDEDEKPSNQNHEDVADKVDAQEMGSVEEGVDAEVNRDDIEEPSTGDDKLQSLGMDENDTEKEYDNKVDDNDEDKKPINQNLEDAANRVDAQDTDSVEVGDDVEPNTADIEEPSTGDDKLLQSLAMDENNFEDEDDNKVDDHDEDEKPSNQNLEDVADRADAQDMDSIEGDDVEPNRDDIKEPSSGDDKVQGLDMNENDVEDEKVTVPESSATLSEPEKEFDAVEAEKEPESSTANSEPAKELESDAMLSTGNDLHDTPILGNSDDEDEGADDIKENETNINDQDEKSEQEQPTSHFTFPKEDQSVVDDEPEPVQNENVPVLPESFEIPSDHEQEPSEKEQVPELPEVSTKSPDQETEPVMSPAIDEVPCDTVDASTSKDTPQSPAVGVDAMEESIDGLENEQKAMQTSEFDEGVQSKESESVPLDMIDEERTEAELATENDHAFVDEKEQTDNDMEDFSDHGVAQENTTMEESSPIEHTKEESTVDKFYTDQLPGDLGAYGSPTTEEESPINDMASDPSTAFKNEDRDNEDWGNYSFETDDFQKQVSANESHDPGAQSQSTKDDQASGVQTCTNPNEDFFNWSVDDTEGNATPYPDSSLKTLFKTSATAAATSQVSFVKDTRETTVKFALPEDDNTAGVSHVKVTQESSTVRFALPQEGSATQIPDSSLKRLFMTPGIAQVNDVKDRQQSTISFVLPNDSFNEDDTSAGTARVSHVNDTQQQSTCSFDIPYDTFGQDEKQDKNQSQLDEDQEHESFEGMNFTEFTHKYFDDDEDEEEDGMKQNELSSEAAAGTSTSHHVDALQDKSVYSEAAHQDSSLNELFKTSASGTTRPSDEDRKDLSGLIEDPKMCIEDFDNKFFDDDGKEDAHFHFKNDPMDHHASATNQHLKGPETSQGTSSR